MSELDTNLIVPVIIAVFSGIFAFGAVIYTKIRPLIYVTVNCWFCNENSRVPISNKNSFICSFCTQYNGFTKDGDYNRDIPAQRMENLNLTFNSKKKPLKTNIPVNNGLCPTCNVNQSLKVKSLAEFQPYLADNYENELEDYRQRLDRMFSLCRDCEGVLHQTLGKQNSWLKPLLITYRLLESKKHIMEVVTSVNRGSIIGFAAKIVLVMASGFVLLSTLYKSFVPNKYLLLQYEPRLSFVYSFGQENLSFICFLSFLFTMVWLISHGRKFIYTVDYCCLSVWILLLGLSSGTFSLEEYSCVSLQLSALVTFLATANTVFSKRNSPKWKNKSAIRIKMNEHDLSQYSSQAADDKDITNSSFTSTSETFNNSVKGHCTPEKLEFRSEKLSYSKPNELTSDNGDLGSSFGSLKIGTPLKNQKAFSAKSLFSEKNCHILAEPKLFSKVSHSWVAGGYWGPTGSPQKGRSNQSVHSELLERRIPSFSLSRSSSHSSGFISQTGTYNSLVDSGRASVCSETDRASRLSESISMYPRRVSQEGFSGSRASTFYSTPSCAFSQSDFPSSRSSLVNESTANFSDVSHLSASNKYMEANPVNGDRVQDRFYVKYCNIIVAFILGISVTANFFLFFK